MPHSEKIGPRCDRRCFYFYPKRHPGKIWISRFSRLNQQAPRRDMIRSRRRFSALCRSMDAVVAMRFEIAYRDCSLFVKRSASLFVVVNRPRPRSTFDFRFSLFCGEATPPLLQLGPLGILE